MAGVHYIKGNTAFYMYLTFVLYDDNEVYYSTVVSVSLVF